jgi:putative transposase
MCRVLGVSRSGYYARSLRPPSERAVANAALIGEIRRVHAESDGTYGSRRVHAQLCRDGHRVNLKRIERLMRVERIHGAYVPAKRRRGGGDGVLGADGVRVWPDLVKRDFEPAGPSELWCSDLKQIPTGEGVLHLASVFDCFSPRIVGWAMGPVRENGMHGSMRRREETRPVAHPVRPRRLPPTLPLPRSIQGAVSAMRRIQAWSAAP